jgi:alkanesulfonate monooxygenase SsuD/methylene tetrahydromethanopterin reductase-like flavin-dependent oxidoreductase (luciferase family)
MVEGTDAPEPKPVDVDRLVKSGKSGPLGSFTYGTPETVAERIRESAAGAPVQTVFLWASIGGMSEDVVAKNVQTIFARLAPLLSATG